MYVVMVGVVRHLVRKNRQERFFMSASEPEGQPTGKWAVILPGAPYNQTLTAFSDSAESECVVWYSYIPHKIHRE